MQEWLLDVQARYGYLEPDMGWSVPSTETGHYFSSFKSFLEFPFYDFDVDLLITGKMLLEDGYMVEYAHDILRRLESVSFDDVASFACLSFALEKDPSLISIVMDSQPSLQLVWCIGQCRGFQGIMRVFNKPFPFDNMVLGEATILLMEYMIDKQFPKSMSPFTSDTYEVFFYLGYCNEKFSLWARVVLPVMTPLIVESSISHILFKRMLPYCAMVDEDGRDFALELESNILSRFSAFPSCASTWISIHPFCVAASNNLIAYLAANGKLTRPMNGLFKQLLRTNKLLKQKKIKLTEETRRCLPRSLWRVKFPCPETDISRCSKTLKQVIDSTESRKWMLFAGVVLLIAIFYAYYIL